MENKYHSQLKESLAGLTGQTERAIAFLGVLGRFLQGEGYALPIVVGGAAVEMYTHGTYASHDIDIKSDMAATLRILTNMGFANKGRSLMYSEEFDLLVDWQGAALEEGRAAQERTLIVTSSDGLPLLRLINVVDLVVDRLEAYKYGKDLESLCWAKVLLSMAQRNGIPMDENVLREQAEAADVADVLEEIWNRALPSESCRP